MNRTNKFFSTIFAICCVITLLACSNSNEKFLKDYEMYVELIEQKVEMNQDINYDECELEMAKFLDRYEKLCQASSWNNYEETKYQQLNNRLSLAIGKSAIRDVSTGVRDFIKNLGESFGY